jgi:hypothetical protein
LEMCHTLRRKCTQEKYRKGRKSKTWIWLMCSLYRNEYSILNWQRPL